jgi:DNA-binding IscR family transcriptional regulator
MAEPIPEDLRRFILTSVPSVPFVEALLIFREAADAGGAPVTIELLARRLYVSERQAAEILDQLRVARIVETLPEGAGHRYAANPELAALLEALAAAYRARLVDVTTLIHSRTGRMAQQFADAFKLRKD